MDFHQSAKVIPIECFPYHALAAIVFQLARLTMSAGEFLTFVKPCIAEVCLEALVLATLRRDGSPRAVLDVTAKHAKWFGAVFRISKKREVRTADADVF